MCKSLDTIKRTEIVKPPEPPGRRIEAEHLKGRVFEQVARNRMIAVGAMVLANYHAIRLEMPPAAKSSMTSSEGCC